MKNPRRKESFYSRFLEIKLADAHAANKGRNISQPPRPTSVHKQPDSNLRVARIIFQTNQHEEVHRLEYGFAQGIIADGKSGKAPFAFTHTTKNKARAYFKVLGRLSAANRAEVLKENRLQY